MSNVIDSIKLSGTVYTLSAQTEGGGVPESAFTAYTASTNERISQDEEVTAAALNVLNESLSGKQDTLSAGTNITISGNVISTSGVVTVVDNEVAPFYAESSAQYEGYYPAQGTDLSYADAYSSVKVMQRSCGFWVRLDITAKLVNESGETITESFRVNNYITSGSAHINVTVLDTTQHFYKLTATDGYRFANVYNFSRVDDGGCYGYIKVYDTFMAGGQSKDVIENVIEPMFAKKQDNLKAGNNIKIDSSNTISVSPTQQIYGYNSYSAYTPSSKAVYDFVAAHSGSSITVDTALDSGSTNPVENRVIYNKIDEVEEVTAAALNELNDAISGKVDTSTYNTYTAATDTALNGKQATLVSGTNIKTINNESILGSGNIDIQGGGGTVESAITSGSTNAVESKAIWSATTFNKGVLLTFNGYKQSTNYPEGCGKLVVGNIGNHSSDDIYFRNDEWRDLGSIRINNFDNISVDTSRFEGATATVDGNIVTIIYPSTGITSIGVINTNWTYTAVVEGAWVNENTYMKLEVDGIANGLQNNINSKLDATAYTPTVVDSALYAGSQNPVQNQALYSELRIDNGETETTLTFENRYSTNYPNGCTKLIVEVVGSFNSSNIEFYNDNQRLGDITIDNLRSINVNVYFDGASYEISGTTVIITYPTVTSVTKIRVNNDGNYVFKAIVANATPLIDQVAANTIALGGKQDTLSAGTGIDITNDIISVTGGSGISSAECQTMIDQSISGKVSTLDFNTFSAATDSRIAEDEEVTAAGINALNDNFGGLKLVKLTQAEYNALATKDSSTLYIIVN